VAGLGKARVGYRAAAIGNPPGQTGTYSVNPNCTGFQQINLGGGVGVVENTFVISNGGRSIDGVVAGFTLGGAAVPDQALVHFSKGASEQND
jgi:hypothetical protein